MAFAPAVVRTAAFEMRAVTSAHREVSPYSFAQTSYDFMGDMWRATLQLAEVDGADRDALTAWLLSLNGPVGTFELHVPNYAGPHGALVSNPLIAAAASERAVSVTVAHTGAGSLVVSDRITIQGHLHVVTAAGARTVDDMQVVTVWPRLRAAVAVGDAIEALQPYGVWALSGPENGWAVDQSQKLSLSLDLIEAL